MSDKFHEWVLKHNIGPGMNDGDANNYSGFDGTVGEGWIPILDRLATDLIALGWDRQLEQVKEKFGGLRFYVGGSSTEIDARITQAEEEARKTCEDCGTQESVTSKGGWIRTLCDSCRKENANG